MAGTLYLVATPIGNLQDITFRAIETLRSVDLIACEDTRRTRKLLSAFEITNKLVSYHEHNEQDRSDDLGKLLAEGRSVALVSDAGTPGINDPGFRLVNKAREIGAKVVPIPGAVAFVNAVVASGLPTDSILFGGFLPSKSSERKQRLSEVAGVYATIVFYESPHRLVKSLADCAEVLGDRRAAVARELTKMHEEFVTGSLTEIASHFAANEPRGEIVIMIDRERSGPAAVSEISFIKRFEELVSQGFDRRDAMKRAAKEFGLNRSEAYRLLQSSK